MSLKREELLGLLDLVAKTADEEIDCDQLLERAAAYLDLCAAGPPPIEGFDDLRQHLRVCPECLEEFEVLVDAYLGDAGAGS